MNLIETPPDAARAGSVDGLHRYRSRRERREALDARTIADLPDSSVVAMTREELVRMICAADLPLPAGYGADRLRLQDQGTLQRLAFLARRACRNRVAILGWRAGSDEP